MMSDNNLVEQCMDYNEETNKSKKKEVVFEPKMPATAILEFEDNNYEDEE